MSLPFDPLGGSSIPNGRDDIDALSRKKALVPLSYKAQDDPMNEGMTILCTHKTKLKKCNLSI